MLALPMLDRDGVAAPLKRLRPEDEKSTGNCASAAASGFPLPLDGPLPPGTDPFGPVSP